MCSPAYRANPRQGAAERRYPRRREPDAGSGQFGGKTNEATKQGKEPLKQGQDKPTAKQKEKQDKAQDKSLKADKPKKSRGMKM